MKGALPIQPPLPSQRKANMFDFPSPGNYLSTLRLAFLSLVMFVLLGGAHSGFGTIFKEVSHTWASPKECHFCR